MAGSLQHCQATQFPWIQAAGAKIHRPDRPKADNALTFKLDHLTGADHFMLDNVIFLLMENVNLLMEKQFV